MKPISDLSEWQVLNDLRRPGSRLVYNPQGSDYVVAPAGRRVERADVSRHLAAGHLRAAADSPPGVYVLTDAGHAAWLRAPSAPMRGVCDTCGLVCLLQPAGDGLLLCAGCAEAQGQEDEAEAEPAVERQGGRASAPLIAGAAVCPGCKRQTLLLRTADGGRLCWGCIKEAQVGGKGHVQ